MHALVLVAALSNPFVLQSNFWMNLHHFLRAAGRGMPIERTMTAEDRKVWDEVVATYKSRWSARDVLFDDGMVKINDALSAARDTAPDFPNEPELKATLERAAPVYRKYWWPAHDARNRSWIGGVQPLLARYVPALTNRLAASYGKTWPSKPIVVDVSVQAGPVGAFTTYPPHSTIASTDPGYLGLASLEILIHESSHQWATILMESISRASKAQNKTVPRQLWHAVLFYNAGELTRRAYFEDGIDDYTEIAVKLYPVLCGEGCRDRVAAAWTPHLDGKATIDEAIEKLVSEWP
jgi:hypothetical protein